MWKTMRPGITDIPDKKPRQTRGPLARSFPGAVDPNRAYDRFKCRRLVRWSGGDADVERDAGTVGDEMELCAVATP
jgi:hypothetical protein